MSAGSRELPLVMEAPRRGKPPRHLADLDSAARRAAVVELGDQAFRADQLSRHYFGRLNSNVESMTDLPPASRERLSALFPLLLTEVKAEACDNGETRKSLWRLNDGALVESVTMKYPDRVTICVSSQAGCGMACPFCATGQGGLTRNLSTAEIVEQVVASARWLNDEGRRVANVVFMGMGEPLANIAAVERALHRFADPSPAGLGISARQLTVSTVGLVPAIERLTNLGMPVRLAVSLHTPYDEQRDTLVPINTRWKVGEVLDAAWRYAEVTKRRVSIEYALIKDINDTAAHARDLAALLRGQLVHVNLIPLNPTPGSIWTASEPQRERGFVDTLRKAGITTTVRDTRGREIAGACGQLAAEPI